MVDNSIGTGRSLRDEFSRARWIHFSAGSISDLHPVGYAPSRKHALNASTIVHAALIAGLIFVNILFWRDFVSAFHGMPLVKNHHHQLECQSFIATSTKVGLDSDACDGNARRASEEVRSAFGKRH